MPVRPYTPSAEKLDRSGSLLVPTSHQPHRRFFIILVTALLAVLSSGALAQSPPDHPERLSVARIFGASEFHEEELGPIHWSKDGSAYMAVEPGKGGKGKSIVRHDPASGESEILVEAEQLIPHGEKEPLGIADFSLSNDGRRLLLFTNTRKVWRLNTRGDYWVFDRDARSLRKLGGK